MNKYFHHILSIFTIVFLFGCHQANPEKQKQEENVRQQLSGEWKVLWERTDFLNDIFTDDGIAFLKDSIEFYSGQSKYIRDSITGKEKRMYFGNFTAYHLRYDSIFVTNPYHGRQEFRWRFLKRQHDTLQLAINDSTSIRLIKLSYKMDTLPDFDRIMYSSSGCFGTCPIMDLAIDKNGNFLFHAEGYLDKHGFYTAKLSPETTNYLFTKFRKANPLRCGNRYSIPHTDDQTITTTYIKDGKIIKTIYDYGFAGPAELSWAYIAISRAYQSTQLHQLPNSNIPFYRKMQYIVFKKGKLVLPLEKSEGFYWWCELKNSKKSNQTFMPVYTIEFKPNYDYWGDDPDRTRKSSELKSINSDGRYFKLEFENDSSQTYDMGYNFIDRHFSKSIFRKPYSWEK